MTAAAVAYPPRRLLANHERAPDIGPVDPVKDRQVQFGDRRERHDPRRVDHNVNTSERLLDLREGASDRLLLGDIGPGPQAPYLQPR